MTKIAYLVNKYPAVSHSFIRREINALEQRGIEIVRFSVRSCASELVDKYDKLELTKTKFILDVGIIGLLWGLLGTALTKPVSFFKAFLLTFKIGWGKDKGILIHLAYLAEACVLLRWVTTAKITHIHAHFAFNPTAVAMLCHVLGGSPFSFTTHGPETFDRASVLSLDEKIKRASFVVAISSYCQSQLYRWCDHQYWSKIHLVHCGLDEQFLNQAPTPVPQNYRLVCVARLAEQKGHLILLEAIHNLVLEGISLKLVLIGDGYLRPQIENLISQMNLQEYVEITGWLTNAEVKQQILDSQAMVLPSFAEGLPVVIMEALALGRPVISTYVAGIPELLENQVCGALVAPGSVAELTSAIKTILNLSEEKLAQMAQEGIKRVQQQHNIEKEAEKLATLFKQYEIPDRQQKFKLNNQLTTKTKNVFS